MTTVVVDADQLIYACGFAVEGEPVSHALQLVKRKLSEIKTKCAADKMEIYIGGPTNFRNEVAITKTYKGTRSSKKPQHYKAMREYMKNKYGAVESDGIETDDVVSILLYEDFVENEGIPEECEVVCASPDKDLNNTPGWHYNYQKDKLYWVSEIQAARHFAYQLLTGDKVDNIPGLPYCTPSIVEEFGLTKAAQRDCGEGSAKKIMEKIPTDENPLPYVYRCYASWALNEGMENYYHEYLTEQGQLLWMLRERDFFGVPYQWHPLASEFVPAIEEQKEKEYGPTDSDVGVECSGESAAGVQSVGEGDQPEASSGDREGADEATGGSA